MASGLPQMRRVTGEDKVGWYMRCLSVVGDNDDVPRFTNGEYKRGRAAMTAVERRLSPLTEVLMCSLSTRKGRGDSTKQAQV
jgi:hypothetical protein